MGIGKHICTSEALQLVYVHIQGKTVNSFSKSNLKSNGFTGVEVFNETMEDIFKGTTATESFLHITVTDGNHKLLVE